MDSIYVHLEHQIPSRLGLSADQVRDWRNAHLVKDQDWAKEGRWIRWTEDGVRKLEAFHAVQLNPVPPPPTEHWAEVTRCNFPNTRIIEVREKESGHTRLVRIKPEWHDLYKAKMPIKIQILATDNLAHTKRPRTRYVY